MREKVISLALLGVLALMAPWQELRAADYQQTAFGALPDGRVVQKITLRNKHGVSAGVISYGATLQSLIVPDRDGRPADVALGYDRIEGYLGTRNYIGATVGRYANRIAQGRFSLDGARQLSTNDGLNSLHGGAKGFDQVLWEVVSLDRGDRASVTLRYVSPDGDQGYPGALTAIATYALDEQNQLSIDYRATTDHTTIVNITNHAYFNLAGEGSAKGAMGHRLMIVADAYTPVDKTLIPTGEIRPVSGTPFDSRVATPVGERVRDMRDPQMVIGRGYDHNWVLSRARTAEPRIIARLEDPDSGRTLELISDQPGLQFYSGNVLDGTEVGKSGRAYRQGDAIVLEPQLYPDTPNKPDFGSARLEPGQVYRNLMVYRISTLPASDASATTVWAPFDMARPLPAHTQPGRFSLGATPPSDATVLFDGKGLGEWNTANTSGWFVEDGELQAKGETSSLLKSKREFGDVQVHLEFRSPNPPGGEGQKRGNSGVFLMGLYEVQILDSYDNRTYADGSLGSLFGQAPALRDAGLPPGEWQAYDIVFEAPRFESSKLISPAYATVFLNGVLIHHRRAFAGETVPTPNPVYAAGLTRGPLAIQEHGDLTGKVRFRNIWVRPLGSDDGR